MPPDNTPPRAFAAQAARELRVSDTEREQVIAALRDAVGQGVLTLAEADERMHATYLARYRPDLAELTADLPGHQPSGNPPPYARPAARRGGLNPAVRLAAIAAVAVVLVSLWLASGSHFFWPAFPLLFITMRLFVLGGRGPWRGGRRAT